MTSARAVSRDDLRALLGRRIGPISNHWGAREAILYALASGATQEHIEYVYEGYGPKLLPTFPIFAAGPLTASAVSLFPDGANPVYAGFRYNFYGQVPLEGELTSTGEIIGIDFHEASALVWIRMESGVAGRLVMSNLSPLHVKSESGVVQIVGAHPRNMVASALGEPLEPLSTAVDARATLLYHLLLPIVSAQPSPDAFHIDPTEARSRGLAGTPLHGAGITGHLGLLLAAAARRYATGSVVELGGRFVGPVFPGDTLTLRLWRPKEGSHQWSLQMENGRGEVIIGKAWVKFGAFDATR